MDEKSSTEGQLKGAEDSYQIKGQPWRTLALSCMASTFSSLACPPRLNLLDPKMVLIMSLASIAAAFVPM